MAVCGNKEDRSDVSEPPRNPEKAQWLSPMGRTRNVAQCHLWRWKLECHPRPRVSQAATSSGHRLRAGDQNLCNVLPFLYHSFLFLLPLCFLWFHFYSAANHPDPCLCSLNPQGNNLNWHGLFPVPYLDTAFRPGHLRSHWLHLDWLPS